MQALLANEGW